VVQAPDDAAYPEMPKRALAAVPDARQATLAELGPTLAMLAAEPAPAPPPVPETLRIEARLTELAMQDTDWHEVPSRPTDFTCPECSGAIREIEGEPIPRYRCRVGHAYSADELVAAKDRAVEDALWLALQTLQERAQMLESMAGEDRLRGRTHSAGGYEERAREARVAADRLRALLAGMAP
jgi:two-component system chemotaxis response regulator CheB